MKNFKNIIWVIALIVILVLIGTLCYGYYKKATMEVKNPIATMEVEGFGTVKMELYPDKAPNTVKNFITLSNRGFYDGLKFHRVVKDFMIQGGDSNGNGTGAPKLNNLKDDASDEKYSIKGEFIANGFKNDLKHEEGVLSMARADYTSYSSTLKEESYNSAGSQFFIMTKNNTTLNGYYTGFGKVIEGMDIVHNIENIEVKAAESEEGSTEDNASKEVSTPVNPPIIKSIRVETFGYDFGEPETLEPFDYQSWLYSQYGLDPNSFSTTTDSVEGTTGEGTAEETVPEDGTSESTQTEEGTPKVPAE